MERIKILKIIAEKKTIKNRLKDESILLAEPISFLVIVKSMIYFIPSHHVQSFFEIVPRFTSSHNLRKMKL
eukprot:snap_masked-scaffold_34-processed-gene-3.55-mRNA-1 protein AED:1.00 eAED:1.00 QI:0/0/0/0/1/1/2/0/70